MGSEINQKNQKILAELEVLLFSYGEPLSIKKVSEFLGVKEGECEDLISQWEEAWKQDPQRGLMFLRSKDEVQLVTKPELKHISEKLAQEEFKEELTPASLEALTIVAYLGPVPRSAIDYIRGVNSSFILRSLLMRGLIRRETKPNKGNVYYYEVSFDFLRHLGLSKVEELLEYEKYKDILQRFETQNVENQKS